MSSPQSSTSSPALGLPGTPEATDVKGLLPDITRPLKKSLDIKHGVAHQIWCFDDFSPAPRSYGKIYMRPTRPAHVILLNYKRQGEGFLSHLRKHWGSGSSTVSSEDSEADQYSDCGRGRPFLRFS